MSNKIAMQWLALTAFSLVLAALYAVPPIPTAVVLVVGFLFLRFRKSETVQSTSWNYVYMSLIQASIIAILSGIVINFSLFISFAIQLLCIFFILRRVVFKGISQSFHWEEEVGSSNLHEKTI